jgi:4-hydroxybenzoate polyprenyltransferase
MIRFSHTVFALPFALAAAVIAWTVPLLDGTQVAFRARDLLGILLCMVCARSAAMAFNRITDRRWDAGNPRTAGRHLPAGTLTVAGVVGFAAAASAGFLAATLLFLPNRWPLVLALPALGFICAYSYTKRFTWLSHFWLGAALMLAPLSVWIALRADAMARQPLDLLPAVILGLAVLLWVAGFDMIYACQDAEFDRRAKLHSIPARFGIRCALHLAALCHLGMMVALVALPLAGRLGGPEVELGWFYGISLAAVGVLLTYEHWIVRPDDLTRVNDAFFRVNAVISVGLLLVVMVDLWLW